VDFKVRALAALDANDGRLYITARQLEVPRSTLRTWAAHRDDIHLEVEKQRSQRALLLELNESVKTKRVAEETRSSDVYAKLARLIEHYHNEDRSEEETSSEAATVEPA
jgi:hypothetical protein